MIGNKIRNWCILVVVVGIFSFLSGCSRMGSEQTANKTANYSANLASANSVSISNSDNNQDLVMTNLNETLYSWTPEQEFAVSTELKQIWVKNGNHPWEYSSKGARKLIARVQSNQYFKHCSQAKALQVKMFEPNGEIQTVGQLYNELYFCNSNNH